MNFNELIPIICRVFTEKVVFKIDMTKSEVQSWDSMGHLNLILEIEDTLSISFSRKEIESINSFKDLLEIINSKQ